jgi:hypothetical protein
VSESESIELHVQRLRAAVLARHGLNPGDAMPEKLAANAVDEVQRCATVSAHWGIASDVPVVGGLLVMFRRVLRILLRWYINPIVEQQNRFNQATVRALWELRLENENLRADLNRRSESSEIARS